MLLMLLCWNVEGWSCWWDLAILVMGNSGGRNELEIFVVDRFFDIMEFEGYSPLNLFLLKKNPPFPPM